MVPARFRCDGRARSAATLIPPRVAVRLEEAGLVDKNDCLHTVAKVNHGDPLAFCVAAMTDAPLGTRTTVTVVGPRLLLLSINRREHTMKARIITLFFTVMALAAVLAPIAEAGYGRP